MPIAAGLYYFAHGADDFARPPIILIHGAGGHHLYWPPQVRRLPNQRVIAVDLPGHGKSQGLGHHAIEGYASEILAFMKALKLNQAVLVGHSMGGAVALQAAMDAPRRVIGLALLGSAARLRVAPGLLQMLSDQTKIASAADIITENSFAAGTSARLKEQARQRLLESRASVLYGDFLACDAFDPTEGLGKVTAPTLIVFGEDDQMVSPQSGRTLQEQLGQARFEIVPGAGHMLMLEQPERVAELLTAFIDSLPYQPGK